MMKSKLSSLLNVSLWAFLAMNCISCAHQTSKEVALTIDTETPAEEHIWSEKKEVSEVAASEESQLQGVENELKPEEQNKAALNVASNDESSVLEPKAEEEKEVTNPQVAKLDSAPSLMTETQTPTSSLQEEVNSGFREAASEAQIEEVTSQSQGEPTVGVPAKVKNEEKLPTRKKRNTSQATPAKSVKEVASETKVETKTEVASVTKVEPKTNDLGEEEEEEESSPQLASVEIATFVQRHWLAVMIGALVTMVGLFFMVRRKQNNYNQSI